MIMADDSTAPPPPPKGLNAGGQALWTAVQAEYFLEEHEEALLTELARTRDQLDALAEIVEREGVLEPGTGRAHPALVEGRQLKIAFARLTGALRLPAGDENDQQAGARRPQRRVGVRQPYGIRGVVS
jgi:hypothetical protein